MKRSKNKTVAQKRPNKLDQIADAMAQDYAHVHTLRVASKRSILEYEVGQLDNELAGLASATTQARECRARLGAMIDGLTRVIAKR